MARSRDGWLEEAYVAARHLGTRAGDRLHTLARRTRSRRWGQDRRLTSYAYAYRRVVAAVHGVHPRDLRRLSLSPPPAEDLKEVTRVMRRLRADAELAERLQAGEPFMDAVVGSVRSLLAGGDHVAARALAQALQDTPETTTTGHLVSGLVALHRGLVELAWSDFAAAGHDAWFAHAPVEYVRTAFLAAPDEALGICREMLREAPELLDAEAWAEMAFATFGIGEYALAGQLVAQAEAAPGAPLGDATRTRVEWLKPWIARGLSPREAEPVPEGHVSFGVLDYDQPDYRQVSTNLGDYVQTLAAMGHVARHQGLRFHGDPELAEILGELQARVRPELVVDGIAADVTLVKLDRDATSLDAVPPRTWALSFGWYMQSQFKLRYDFPFHENIRPIFVSFHINRRDLLTPAAVEYLCEYGPVGCRDWTTVDLLLSVGVPAFFSGCITTTVDTLFAAPVASDPSRPTAYVDVKLDQIPRGQETHRSTQADESVRIAPFAPNLRDAIAMLERYRREYGRIVTGRLHCYLPSRSLGMAVDFVPRNRSDIRFNGLLDLSDDQFDAMRSGIRDMLLPVLGAVFSGASDERVYALWREVTAEATEAARVRRESVPPLPAPSFDVAGACKVVQAERVDIDRTESPPGAADELDIALALDENLREQLPIVLDGLVQHASRPLHFWILSRGHGPVDHQRLARLFPDASFTWLPCDAVDYGPVLGMLKHITVSTMDRLLLPDLLPELSRVVYHDIDALCLTDIAPLYDTDLEGRPLAARSSIARDTRSGFGNIYSSGKRLQPEEAFDLYRRMHARFDFDFVAFNAGILVLDLEHMRRDDFCREFMPFVEHYGMNDQEVLNCYAGPNRVVLDRRWNSIAAQEPVTEPWLVHWAGPSKPWGRHYILFQHEWQRQERHLSQRAQRD